MVEYICPKCRSNRAGVVESSSASQCLRYLCQDCGHTEYVDYYDCDGHGRWIRDSREESKEVVKQRVIRTHSSDHPRPHEALVTALNGGWKIVMCHPIGNELEYILEKKVKE